MISLSTQALGLESFVEGITNLAPTLDVSDYSEGPTFPIPPSEQDSLCLDSSARSPPGKTLRGPLLLPQAARAFEFERVRG